MSAWLSEGFALDRRRRTFAPRLRGSRAEALLLDSSNECLDAVIRSTESSTTRLLVGRRVDSDRLSQRRRVVEGWGGRQGVGRRWPG